jgi:AraC family ethanolamine operon transcriptional activator
MTPAEHIYGGTIRRPLRGSPRRQLLAQRAEELLRRHLAEPVTIRDLCEKIGVSRRSLHLGFREYFGMSPKQYVKKLRLSCARHDLCNASPGTLVTDVAVRWSFFHLGRFASDYTRCFGESPSHTLTVHRSPFLDSEPGPWRPLSSDEPQGRAADEIRDTRRHLALSG